MKFDKLVKELDLSQVDLLKLDVEGNEFKALVGAKDTLKKGIIQCILFEYGGTYLSSNSSLKSIYDLLGNLGFEIFKLFPKGSKRRAYSLFMENYQYANYLAKRINS